MLTTVTYPLCKFLSEFPHRFNPSSIGCFNKSRSDDDSVGIFGNFRRLNTI